MRYLNRALLPSVFIMLMSNVAAFAQAVEAVKASATAFEVWKTSGLLGLALFSNCVFAGIILYAMKEIIALSVRQAVNQAETTSALKELVHELRKRYAPVKRSVELGSNIPEMGKEDSDV